MRQAHYQAGDDLHGAQGQLAEAALEVSRLEERIRYVVESRQRGLQRLEELKAQDATWQQRSIDAGAELTAAGARIAAADEQAERLAAQAQAHTQQQPALDDALRDAQAQSNEQRDRVAEVQQQLQLLAADSRNVDEQVRSLRDRREKLAGERQGLSAPDSARLTALELSSGQAVEAHALLDAQLAALSDEVPTLDANRRTQQEVANRESGRQADIGARLDALRALQEKVQTEGKLKPWLGKHGLEGLHGLWTQVHIETGWEPALEAALRERLNALEVGRLESVRAFAGDAPPARLAFYTKPVAAIANTHQALARLSDLLRLGDAGLKALLNDWLEGVYTAASLDEALAARGTLTHGEVIMTRDGHAVSQFAVTFYAPDSEQAGMLARAQEIENLERQQRAQALIADEARSALVRAEAAYTEGSIKLARVRREAGDAQTRAHQMQVELMRLAQLAAATQARGSQLDDEVTEIDARLQALAERRASGEARFDEFDIQLAATQERHAELDEAVIAAERALAAARDEGRALERQAQEAQFESRTLAARRAELQRAIDTAAEQVAANAQAAAQINVDLGALDDAVAQAGLQAALAVKLEREAALAAQRSQYDDLTAKLRALDEQRLTAGAQPGAAARAHHQAAARTAGRVAGWRAVPRAAQRGGRRPGRVGAVDQRRGGQVAGPAGRNRPHPAATSPPWGPSTWPHSKS